MKGKKHYAYKRMLPALWQAVFYLLVAMAAAYLVIGSDGVWDKLLTAALLLISGGYAFVQVRRFLGTYYQVDEDGVVFMLDGRRFAHRFDDVEDVQYDSTHVGIRMVFHSGYMETHKEYSDLSPLIQALDQRGIRIEYMKMDR